MSRLYDKIKVFLSFLPFSIDENLLKDLTSICNNSSSSFKFYIDKLITEGNYSYSYDLHGYIFCLQGHQKIIESYLGLIGYDQ